MGAEDRGEEKEKVQETDKGRFTRKEKVTMLWMGLEAKMKGFK